MVKCEPEPCAKRAKPFGNNGPTKQLSPLIICGPSGVGKGTLIARMMKEFPDAFCFSVSHTTRAPRPGEVNGVHYHFLPLVEMQQNINEGQFVEHAGVHSNLYGTSSAELESVRAQGKIAVLDIDIKGAKQLKQNLKDAHYIFLMPPSVDVLERRLRGRNTESEEKIQLRLENAKDEIEFSNEVGFFDQVIIADDNFVNAVDELRRLFCSWYPHLRRDASLHASQM